MSFCAHSNAPKLISFHLIFFFSIVVVRRRWFFLNMKFVNRSLNMHSVNTEFNRFYVFRYEKLRCNDAKGNKKRANTKWTNERMNKQKLVVHSIYLMKYLFITIYYRAQSIKHLSTVPFTNCLHSFVQLKFSCVSIVERYRSLLRRFWFIWVCARCSCWN